MSTEEDWTPAAPPQLSPEFAAENELFRRCLKAQLLQKVVPREIPFESVTANRLKRVGPFVEWAGQLTAAGFLPAGNFTRGLLFGSYFAAFVNPEQSCDAVIAGDPRRDELRCDLFVHGADGTVFNVTNYADPPAPDFPVPWVTKRELPNASPSNMLATLWSIAPQVEGREQFGLESFESRYRSRHVRFLRAIHERAEELLVPRRSLGNRPARFERLGFYLKLDEFKDPSFTSQSFAERELADLNSPTGLDNDSLRESQIRSAMFLVAMRHFQFLGARSLPNYVPIGVQAAINYFESLAGRKMRRSGFQVLELMLESMLLAMLSDDLPSVRRICSAVESAFGSKSGRFDYDPPLEFGQFCLVLASHFRDKPIRNVSKLESAISEGRPKRPRLLLNVWQTIRHRNDTGFSRALRLSLEYIVENPPKNFPHNHLPSKLPMPESVLVNAALRFGLEAPALPESLADLLVTPQSLQWR